MTASSSAQQGGFSWSLILMFVAFGAVFIYMQRSAKKRMQSAMEEREKEIRSLTPGTWVRTASGFYGKVVEIDGEVMVLSNLTGEESLWDMKAITVIQDPPFASRTEETDSEEEMAEQAEADSAPAAEAESQSDDEAGAQSK